MEVYWLNNFLMYTEPPTLTIHYLPRGYSLKAHLTYLHNLFQYLQSKINLKLLIKVCMIANIAHNKLIQCMFLVNFPALLIHGQKYAVIIVKERERF